MRSVKAQFRKGKLRCVSKGPNRSGIALIRLPSWLRWPALYQELLGEQVTIGVIMVQILRSAALDPAADPWQAGHQS